MEAIWEAIHSAALEAVTSYEVGQCATIHRVDDITMEYLKGERALQEDWEVIDR